ncbi:MAG: ESX secretion-associated protein EspG [Kibdelosporangium sp.]
MTIKTDFVLSAREFDFVWTALDLGRLPYPIDVPSVGETVEERSRLRDETFDALRGKGLLRGDRPDPDLADLLRVLAAPKVSVDTVGYANEAIRGLAASDGSLAALVALRGDVLSFAAIRTTALATSIVDVLPPGEPGVRPAISLPQQALQRAVDGDDDDPFGDGDERDILVGNGVNEQDATTLIELAERRTSGGQFGVTTTSQATRVRAGTRTRSKTIITWFDTGEGRYLMVNDGTWISLAPADAARIANRINELLRTA